MACAFQRGIRERKKETKVKPSHVCLVQQLRDYSRGGFGEPRRNERHSKGSRQRRSCGGNIGRGKKRADAKKEKHWWTIFLPILSFFHSVLPSSLISRCDSSLPPSSHRRRGCCCRVAVWICLGGGGRGRERGEWKVDTYYVYATREDERAREEEEEWSGGKRLFLGSFVFRRL